MSTTRLFKPAQQFHTDGQPLCLCGCNRRVYYPRRYFNSRECYYRFKVMSDASFARQQVELRDNGICAACRTDTNAVMDRLRRMKRSERLATLKRWNIPLTAYRNGSLWQMDHIRPVEHGGGSCELSNLQTLCLSCHRRKTATQASQRAERRRRVDVLSEARMIADAVQFD